MKRIILMGSIGLILLLSESACKGAQSEWVYPGSDGKLIYKRTPRGDRIMDFSSAGYMGGGVALPAVPVKRIVNPSGGPDDTAIIQAAVDEIAALPLENGFRGTVLLAPGIYPCSKTIFITSDGVVLRGGGMKGSSASTIRMTGDRHCAIVVGRRAGRDRHSEAGRPTDGIETFLADDYVPCGATGFTTTDAKGFVVGDIIWVRRPVTSAWIHFMQMDDLTRGGRPQTWLRDGSLIDSQRTVTSVSDNRITLDIPLTDSFDARYLNPPGTQIIKTQPAPLITQTGVENLRIQAPPMEVGHTQYPYTALRINGRDCWARKVAVEETMNSVGVSGRRITLQEVRITRTVPNVGGSKPAEFAPNASQVLLDRCSSSGDNIWQAATGARVTGPIVLLNCTFSGNGHIEGHQRWTTGILLDNCRLPEGGIDFKNRGSMGSGHGWGTGWSVAWNCIARTYVIQQPPGAINWAIGCIGERRLAPRPFDSQPDLPEGLFDSHGTPVTPKSLYLAQLKTRLGPQALKNIGY